MDQNEVNAGGRSSEWCPLRSNRERSGRMARGFTLVELLVVIGIIALLISVLLPVLGKARAAANTTKCLANLRTMGQAMQLYASQNRGAILGSAVTSSRFMYPGGLSTAGRDGAINSSKVYPDMPIEVWDFITPMAKVMSLKLVSADSTDPLVRFVAQADNKYFQCPAAQGSVAVPFGAPVGAPNIEPIGYVTAMGFLLTSGSPTPGETSYTRYSTGSDWPAPPSSYFPNVTKVGPSSLKIFAADGAKYTYNGSPQEYEISPYPVSSASTGNHSKYTDWGAWSDAASPNSVTGAYDRTSFKTGGVDGRIASFRHGARSGHRDGTFKMNVAYFDGHAETIDDIAATNPALWLPRGTNFKLGVAKMAAATATRWGVNSTSYVVP